MTELRTGPRTLARRARRTADAGPLITVESDLDPSTAAIYWDLYRDTFGELETRAVARQVLHEHEFLEEMHDPRVMKYVAWSPAGEVIGLSTLTRDLASVPWISPAYFAHHYPEHTARGAVYYLGFTLVDRRYRKTRVFQAMIERVVELLVAERAVCGWDMCAHNDLVLGLGSSIEALLNRNAEVTVLPIDVQTYYSATFTGRTP